MWYASHVRTRFGANNYQHLFFAQHARQCQSSEETLPSNGSQEVSLLRQQTQQSNKDLHPLDRTSSQHSSLGPRSSTSRNQTWSQQCGQLPSKIFVKVADLPELKECLVNCLWSAWNSWLSLISMISVISVVLAGSKSDQYDSPWSSMVPCPWSTFKELASDNRPRWPSPSTVSNMQTLP